jgi:hypothetical protein
MLIFVSLVIFLTAFQRSYGGSLKPDGAKVLNNFVTELLNVPVVSETDARYSFCNPREGWVFISSTAEIAGSGCIGVSLDSKSAQEAVIVHGAGKEPTQEAMRFIPAGEHKIDIHYDGSSSPLKSLTVRAIPDLIYCQFGVNPVVTEYGSYDWDFLDKHILKNVNVLAVGASEQLPALITDKWKNQGKRWIGICGVHWEGDASDVYNYWVGICNKNPHLDGIIVDEFGPEPRHHERYPVWIDAIKRFRANEQLKNKLFYAWTFDSLWDLSKRGKPTSIAFVQALMDCSYLIADERYLMEKPTEEQAKVYLESREFKQHFVSWEKSQPGVMKHINVCFALFSTPPCSRNNNPGVNFKTWMDMQVNMAANDSAFSGVNGLFWWTGHYADEETVRWEGKLFRHYCIEGKTEMLSQDPYLLTHIENPDFSTGRNGWTIKPAETTPAGLTGSMDIKSYKDYGKIQGRWNIGLPYRQGEDFMWMKRSSKGPNVFSQEIKNLQPGRLYSMKMFTTDYNSLVEGKKTEMQKYAIRIEIEGAEVDGDRSFQNVSTSCKPGEHGGFEYKDIWINYHWVLFRGKAENARLVVSDWASEKEPGGPIGQELICNFIEIQPYLEE